MDARLDVEAMLGLRTGEAHVIRNAGGLATEDVIRSLVVSQQLLGTDEIVVIGHTGCGLLNADEDALRDRLTAETGEALDIGFGSFDDLAASIRSSVEILRTHPWLKRVPVHGLASMSRPADSARSPERNPGRTSSSSCPDQERGHVRRGIWRTVGPDRYHPPVVGRAVDERISRCPGRVVA